MQKKNREVLFVNDLNVVNKDTFVDKKETITKIRLKDSRLSESPVTTRIPGFKRP